MTRSGAPRVQSPWERFGWLMAVVWLVFLWYPLAALLESAAPAAWIACGWVGLVAFATLYVSGFIVGVSPRGGGLGRPTARWQWIVFAALLAATAGVIPAVGTSALSFVPFLSAYATYALTRPMHWLVFGAGVASTVIVTAVWPDDPNNLIMVVVVVMVGVINSVSRMLILRSQQAERLGLELATSEGREAVARDVHDLIGHSLTVVRLKAQLARRLLDTDPARARRELADIEELAAQAIADVRATVAGTHVGTLADQIDGCTRALAAAGITVHREGDPRMLSAAQSLTAGWILREATTNVLRHARARTVTVRIAPGSLTVTDDGVGVEASCRESDAAAGTAEDADAAAGHPGTSMRHPGPGNGIRGMRDRAAAAAATLTVGPCPGQGGTQVAVTW